MTWFMHIFQLHSITVETPPLPFNPMESVTIKLSKKLARIVEDIMCIYLIPQDEATAIDTEETLITLIV
jgi:hypothetical protein